MSARTRVYLWLFDRVPELIEAVLVMLLVGMGLITYLLWRTLEHAK